jgi:hypothetical protein
LQPWQQDIEQRHNQQYCCYLRSRSSVVSDNILQAAVRMAAAVQRHGTAEAASDMTQREQGHMHGMHAEKPRTCKILTGSPWKKSRQQQQGQQQQRQQQKQQQQARTPQKAAQRQILT